MSGVLEKEKHEGDTLGLGRLRSKARASKRDATTRAIAEGSRSTGADLVRVPDDRRGLRPSQADMRQITEQGVRSSRAPGSLGTGRVREWAWRLAEVVAFCQGALPSSLLSVAAERGRRGERRLRVRSPAPNDMSSPDPSAGPASRVVRALLYLGLLTPLVAVPGILFPFVVPRAVFLRLLVELALGVALFLVVRHEVRARGGDWFLWGIAAFLGVNVVAATLGDAPVRSLFSDVERMWGLFSWFHLAVLYVLLRSFVPEQGWRRFLTVAVGVAAVVAAVSILEGHSYLFDASRFGNTEGSRLYRSMSTVGNAGFTAAYLVLSMGVALVLALSTPQPRRRLFFGALAALLLGGALLTRTRASLVGMAVGALVAVIFFAAHGGSRRTVRTAGLATGAALGVVLLLALTGVALPGLDRFTRVPLDPSRLTVWDMAVRALPDQPLLGYGMENGGHLLNERFDPRISDVPRDRGAPIDRLHNVVLDTLATAGLPGLLALAMMWLGLFWNIRVARRAGRLGPGEAAILAGVAAAYLAHLVFWFEDWISYPLFLVIAAYIGRSAAGTPVLEVGQAREWNRKRAVLLALGALVLLLAAYQQNVRVLFAARTAARAARSADFDERLRLHVAALSYSIPGERQLIFALTTDLSRLAEQLPQLNLSTEERDLLDRAVAAGANALAVQVALDPREDLLHSRLAEVQRFAMLLHRSPELYQAASRSAERAISLSPDRVQYYEQLAEIHLRARRVDEAEHVLRRGLAVYDRLASTRFLMAMVQLLRDEPERAADWMLAALATGEAPDRHDLVLLIGEALRESGDPAREAALYEAYLNARVRTYPPAPVGSAGRKFPKGDFRVAARLPVAHLRLGNREKAVVAARRLFAAAPETAPQVQRFIRAVQAGEWTGGEEVVGPGDVLLPR